MWICVLNSRLSIISFYNLNGFLKKKLPKYMSLLWIVQQCGQVVTKTMQIYKKKFK